VLTAGPPTLLVAAHGTQSAVGGATTRQLIDAVAAARPEARVSVCFLDVASPSLPDALEALNGRDVVIVPLLLSAGYHVLVDIPGIVASYPSVRVTRHLGPDPAIVDAVASRLESAGGSGPTLLAAIASSKSSARDEVDVAARLLSSRLGRDVAVLPLYSSLPPLPSPVQIAVYLLAEGGFLDSLRESVGENGVVAEPIGVHPALVELVWSRYDEVVNAVG